MKIEFNGKTKKLLMSALALFVCVALTGIAVFDRLGGFLLDDSGAILLLPDFVETEVTVRDNEMIMGAANSNRGNKTEVPKGQPISGYKVEDDDTVWTTDTMINIFKISYENGQQIITVNGNGDEKVIAPGTENSYTFKLKNNGIRAVDYIVTVEAFFTPEDISIPVRARINRYDGEWIAGDQDNWVDVPTLNGTEDEDTLGAGKYTYYTLDWEWPFESGDDEYDTWLGNSATEQDLELTIIIHTLATASSDENNQNGITPPKTGDMNPIGILAVTGSVSLGAIILLWVDDRREKKCARK